MAGSISEISVSGDTDVEVSKFSSLFDTEFSFLASFGLLELLLLLSLSIFGSGSGASGDVLSDSWLHFFKNSFGIEFKISIKDSRSTFGMCNLRRALKGLRQIGHAACWYRIFSAHSAQTARCRQGRINVSRGLNGLKFFKKLT